MILVCPLCQTRYLVQAHLFTAGPRQVHCARCNHGWKAEPPREIDVVGVPPPEPAPIPEHVAPIPRGSNLPVLAQKSMSPILHHSLWIATAALLAAVLIWLILDRQNIAHRWTFMEPLYNAVDLYIYYPGDGLEFDQVRSELKFDSGITKLVLEGKIKNRTKKNQKVPNIIASALGPDGRIIQSWQIDAPKATLVPEEGASFASSINAPKGTVVNVTLNFVETSDDK